jgi:hypothetical protein
LVFLLQLRALLFIISCFFQRMSCRIFVYQKQCNLYLIKLVLGEFLGCFLNSIWWSLNRLALWLVLLLKLLRLLRQNSLIFLWLLHHKMAASWWVLP